MAHLFGSNAHERLGTIHPDLARVIQRAVRLSDVDIAVLEGVRSLERQRKLLASGATTTLRSRHLAHARDGLARAVDIAPVVDGEVRWDWPLYHRLAAAVKNAAAEENVPVEWGGDWKTFKDGPHWQVPWNTYP